MAEVQTLVKEFTDAFNTPTHQGFWANLVIEESKEVNEAIDHLLKELCDLVYVGAGYMNVGGDTRVLEDNTEVCTALKWADAFSALFGTDRLEEAFLRVHKSNMSKLGDDGKPVRREDGKVLKGPNYQPPVLSDLVRL